MEFSRAFRQFWDMRKALNLKLWRYVECSTLIPAVVKHLAILNKPTFEASFVYIYPMECSRLYRC